MSAFNGPGPETQPSPSPDPNLDLGFGAVVARDSRKRLLNRDGTFNVRRGGLGFWASLSLYHAMLTMSWRRFLALVGGVYLIANALFGLGYVACGVRALSSFPGKSLGERFGEGFFFSVETLATIGYGNISPTNLASNLLVTFESLIGLLGFAIVAGFVFARFARPNVQIVFSENALVAPYRDHRAFMFRIVNQRSNEIVELDAKVILSLRREGGGSLDRDFVALSLEREHVVFFPLSWTVVHPIDEKSPLFNLTIEDLKGRDAEFLVLLNGFDETFSQNVHTRTSYRADELIWGARFRSIFNPPREDGSLSVDIRKLHLYDAADV